MKRIALIGFCIAMLVCLSMIGCETAGTKIFNSYVTDDVKEDICKEVPGNGFGLCKDEPVDSTDIDSL